MRRLVKTLLVVALGVAGLLGLRSLTQEDSPGVNYDAIYGALDDFDPPAKSSVADETVLHCAEDGSGSPMVSRRFNVEALPREARLGLVDHYVAQADRLGWSPESLTPPPSRGFSNGDLALFVIPEPTEDGITDLVLTVSDLSQAC